MTVVYNEYHYVICILDRLLLWAYCYGLLSSTLKYQISEILNFILVYLHLRTYNYVTSLVLLGNICDYHIAGNFRGYLSWKDNF